MTPRVSLVAPARSASADFPSRCVVPARRAPHVHAVAFEVQDRVVPAKSADKLAETPERASGQAVSAVLRDFSGRRELLGVIGHHGRTPFPSPYP